MYMNVCFDLWVFLAPAWFDEDLIIIPQFFRREIVFF